jgi:phosphoribosylpyrophosphate synthetase
MIKLINSNSNEEHIVVPTMFPDETSQVWKLPEQFVQKNVHYKIIWEFQHESELIHVAQLAKLLVTMSSVYPTLEIPYLPYGRQDKEITNESTFALKAFMMLIRQIEVDSIYTLDAHNKNEIYPIVNMNVNKEIKFAIDSTECHFICFPDKGASQRGYNIQNKHFFCLEKIRNQLT